MNHQATQIWNCYTSACEYTFSALHSPFNSIHVYFIRVVLYFFVLQNVWPSPENVPPCAVHVCYAWLWSSLENLAAEAKELQTWNMNTVYWKVPGKCCDAEIHQIAQSLDCTNNCVIVDTRSCATKSFIVLYLTWPNLYYHGMKLSSQKVCVSPKVSTLQTTTFWQMQARSMFLTRTSTNQACW